MAVKLWLQERWAGLFPLLQALTVEQEEEIQRLCLEEIEHWRARGISGSALRVPMTATRKEIKGWSLVESNSYVNPRTREKEHIALKYMNFSSEEWAAMNAPSKEKAAARLELTKYIDAPAAVVDKAVELLKSPYWYEIAAGLAPLLGRRVDELVNDTTELYPCTAYSLKFKGQLKRRDKVLPPYEIPTNAEASLCLDAWRRLRLLVGDKEISDKRLVSEAADYHFSSSKLVPPRDDKDDLYTHLFRSVYGAIAVFYYCPPDIFPLKYLATIYGHYWVLESTGKQQEDYMATLRYADYEIGDAAIYAHNGKRKGIKLDAPGVEVLEVFKEKPVIAKKGAKMAKTKTDELTEKASQTGYSMLKPKQETKDRIYQIIEEEGLHSSSLHDEALRLLVDEHYQLKQFKQLGVNVEALAALLLEAAQDNSDVLAYLASLVTAKREFKKSYEKRHEGKDYSTMTLEELRNTKTTEAAYERFGRAVAAIMAYNDAALPDLRWFINPSVVTLLVGGKPSLAKKYIEVDHKEEIDAHHKKNGITEGYNRRPVSIVYRVAVPERIGEEGNLEKQVAEYEEREARRKAKKAGAQEEDE